MFLSNNKNENTYSNSSKSKNILIWLIDISEFYCKSICDQTQITCTIKLLLITLYYCKGLRRKKRKIKSHFKNLKGFLFVFDEYYFVTQKTHINVTCAQFGNG